MRYKVYSDGTGKIIVTSTYAGRTVRGTAKCAPQDTYDRTIGVELATARCDAKVADKRYENAKKKYDEACIKWNQAQEYLANMSNYLKDSYEKKMEAHFELEKLKNSL